MGLSEYKNTLTQKMDSYVHRVYQLTRQFPREELYGSSSQIRRAALSVILNYTEGFARRRPAAQLNFLEISYGSLRESKYLLGFAKDESWISEQEFNSLNTLAEEIGAMLWTEIKNLSRSNAD